MKGERAMEIFKVVIKNKMLPSKIEEVVPLKFIGQAAVGFYREKLKMMDSFPDPDEIMRKQRDSTLSDAQEAGDLLLDIETKIGNWALKEEQARSKGLPGGGAAPSGSPPKHERLGLTRSQMKTAEKIAKNPKAVEKVKKQARVDGDIPSKGAVVATVNYEKQKEANKKAKESLSELKGIIAIEQTQYINALDKAIRVIPIKPPKKWNEQAFKEAKSKAQIIIKRLEVFNGAEKAQKQIR